MAKYESIIESLKLRIYIKDKTYETFKTHDAYPKLII